MDRAVWKILPLICVGLVSSCGGEDALREGGLCVVDGDALERGAWRDDPVLCQRCVCVAGGRLECAQVECPEGGVQGISAHPTPAVRERGPFEALAVDAPDRVERCFDRDGDGFYGCIDPSAPQRPEQVDCDDNRAQVLPGGAEFPTNGVDDNCDGRIDEVRACACPQLPMRQAAEAEAMLGALGLCHDDIQALSIEGDPRQFAVLKGDPWLPVAPGVCLAALSTGVADPTHPDFRAGGVQPGQSFDRGSEDPFGPGERVQDAARWRVELTPPANARGFQFRYMFVSSEWPEYLCHVFNDTFTALLSTQALDGGTPTNITLDELGRRITINTTFFEHPDDWTVDLEVTPFGKLHDAFCLVETHQAMYRQPGCELPEYCSEPESLTRRGSGTGWLTARAPVEMGERRVVLDFNIHDGSDGLLNSMVLLGGFQWLPWSPTVGTAKE